MQDMRIKWQQAAESGQALWEFPELHGTGTATGKDKSGGQPLKGTFTSFEDAQLPNDLFCDFKCKFLHDFLVSTVLTNSHAMGFAPEHRRLEEAKDENGRICVTSAMPEASSLEDGDGNSCGHADCRRALPNQDRLRVSKVDHYSRCRIAGGS